MKDRLNNYIKELENTSDNVQGTIVLMFMIILLISIFLYGNIISNHEKTDYIIQQTMEIKELNKQVASLKAEKKESKETIIAKQDWIVEIQTKNNELKGKLNERNFENEWQNELLIKLSNLGVIKQSYYIRNEILYWSKLAVEKGVREKVISLEEASYQALWIYAESVENGVHPYLQMAVGVVENKLYHTTKRNKADAVGMFQLTPIVEGMYQVDGLIFEENLKGSSKFIRDLNKQYDDLDGALGHYNGGSRPYYKIENYKETGEYVAKVKHIYNSMMKKYN